MLDVPPPNAAFYFDLASPLAYLAAERVLQVLPGAAEWQPVLARELGPAADPFDAFRCESDEDAFRERVERRAEELGLQPLRWPARFPFDSAAGDARGDVREVASAARCRSRRRPFARRSPAGTRSTISTTC